MVYNGDMEDIAGKVSFVKNAFEQAGIPVPRGMKEWYTKGKGISRTTAFQICFAFGLGREETDDFFRRVMLQKSFDCHVMEEAIYYFCMRNGKNYTEAAQMLEASPQGDVPDVTKSRMVFDGDILFTSSIMREMEKFKTKEELLAYFRRNVEKFGYNHAGATEEIRKLWEAIREKENGLADLEKMKIQGCGRKAETDRSVSEILRQILGLDETEQIPESEGSGEKTQPLFVLKSDRSIKPLLKDNPLLPEAARKQFPNRQTIEKILKGEHVELESIRKTLILTYFYYFWIRKALRQQERGASQHREESESRLARALNMTAYQAKAGDDERFIDAVNRRLLELGYPELYLGNPYDWIFVYCSRSEEPLPVFREFIHEMYLENEAYIIEMNQKQTP